MKNCKICGFQLEDTEMICPVCGSKVTEETTEIHIIDVDDKETVSEINVDEEEETVCKRKEVILIKDIGSHAQVEVSFNDGTTICMKKTVARRLYPESVFFKEDE